MRRLHSTKSDIIDITVSIRGSTDRAVLVDYGERETVWLPLSLIEIAPNSDGRTHTVTLPEWLAEERGMV
jgi:hypothetical protein